MAASNVQTLWLAETAGVYRTTDRVVHVRGDDAQSWLNGQVSNDVRTLSADEGRYAVTLTVKGRVVSDLWAVDDAPDMAVVLPGRALDTALARFDKHIIMEDVELEADDELVVLTVQGPRAAEVMSAVPEGLRRYTAARLGTVGFDCWVPAAQADQTHAALVARAEALGGGGLDEAAWERAHVALAVPRFGVDFGEDTYPQEAGIGARALSFGKGCYLGQEVVYMLHNRGQLARRLVQLESEAEREVTPGTPVTDADGKRLGEVTSHDRDDWRSLCLAYVKRAASDPEQTVWLAGSPWRVRRVVGASERRPTPVAPIARRAPRAHIGLEARTSTEAFKERARP